MPERAVAESVGSNFDCRVMTNDQDTVHIIRQVADHGNKLKRVAVIKVCIFNSVALRKLKFDRHDFGSLFGTRGVAVQDEFREYLLLT